MLLLTLLLGTLVGFSLGMTGGGGAIFAVPLLVYVLEFQQEKRLEYRFLPSAALRWLASFNELGTV